MALQDKKIMPPPWLAHREIERYSIGWRMGYGEDYIYRFGDWLDTLSPEERTEYRTLFPEPVTWKGWWDDEDSSEVLEHGDFLVDAWQPEGQPKYTRQWLQQEFAAGRKRELCLFWGHQPSEDGQLTKSCLSQWWMEDFYTTADSYLCMEQYMMAAKAELFGDKEIRDQILKCSDQKQIKALGRKTIGVIFSLGFGILADKFDKKRYMLLAITAFASGFIAIPLVNNVTLVVLFFALINCAYSVFATVLKAWFADNLSSNSKTKIFSINYTMLNIGWTIGPPLGTLLVMQSINLPFWLAAICSAFPMLFIQIWVKRSEKIIATETGSVWSPKVLLQDKALLWFTCSGFLASFVSGAFASCISQYVMVIADGDFAEKVCAFLRKRCKDTFFLQYIPNIFALFFAIKCKCLTLRTN